jgi:integrase
MAAGFLVKTRPGCPTDFRLLVQAALLSGARYDQVCRLAVRDYNPDAGTLTLRKKGKAPERLLAD